jgi:hypothetical protein
MSEPRDRIAEALGADRVVALPGLPSQGPLDLLQLQEEVRRMLSEERAVEAVTMTCECEACSTTFACAIPQATVRTERLFCPNCGARLPRSPEPTRRTA